MSALLAHAKAFRALAESYKARAAFLEAAHLSEHVSWLRQHAEVYADASFCLEQQAADECSGEARTGRV